MKNEEKDNKIKDIMLCKNKGIQEKHCDILMYK